MYFMHINVSGRSALSINKLIWFDLIWKGGRIGQAFLTKLWNWGGAPVLSPPKPNTVKFCMRAYINSVCICVQFCLKCLIMTPFRNKKTQKYSYFDKRLNFGAPVLTPFTDRREQAHGVLSSANSTPDFTPLVQHVAAAGRKTSKSPLRLSDLNTAAVRFAHCWW